MRTIKNHDAKTNLARLVEQASGGDLFAIAKADASRHARGQPPQRLGFMVGQMRVPDDFDQMGKESIHERFTGRT